MCGINVIQFVIDILNSQYHYISVRIILDAASIIAVWLIIHTHTHTQMSMFVQCPLLQALLLCTYT